MKSLENLLSYEEFKGIKFPEEKVDIFLKTVQEKSDEITPEAFLGLGLNIFITPGIIYVVKKRLAEFLKENAHLNTPEVKAASISLYGILNHVPVYQNLFFVLLFVKNIKDHPLISKPELWKLIYPFLPSKKVETGVKNVIIPDEDKTASKKEEDIIITDNKKKEDTGKIILP